MLTFNWKSITATTAVLICSAVMLIAQPPFHARERISEFKKIKLLEILDLDEQTSEKFLAKYNSAEKIISEKLEKVQDAMLDLEYALRKKSGKEEIAKNSQKVMDAQRDLLNTMVEQQKEIKGILNEEQFAKYLLFENRFKSELQRLLIERAKGEKGKKKFRPKGSPDGE